MFDALDEEACSFPETAHEIHEKAEMRCEELFGSALYNSAVYSDEEEAIFGSPVGEALRLREAMKRRGPLCSLCLGHSERDAAESSAHPSHHSDAVDLCDLDAISGRLLGPRRRQGRRLRSPALNIGLASGHRHKRTHGHIAPQRATRSGTAGPKRSPEREAPQEARGRRVAAKRGWTRAAAQRLASQAGPSPSPERPAARAARGQSFKQDFQTVFCKGQAQPKSGPWRQKETVSVSSFGKFPRSLPSAGGAMDLGATQCEPRKVAEPPAATVFPHSQEWRCVFVSELAHAEAVLIPGHSLLRVSMVSRTASGKVIATLVSVGLRLHPLLYPVHSVRLPCQGGDSLPATQAYQEELKSNRALCLVCVG